MLKRLCLFSAVILLLVSAHAQTTSGTVTGVVTDSSGAVIPGASISVTDQDTSVQRDTKSNESGVYIFPQLPPGTYSVSAKAQGFAFQSRTNVRLDVNQSVTLDFKMSAGSVSQTVSVTTAAPMLNTTSATLSSVIGHEETVDLPLNGRQFTELTLLTPGVAPVEQSQQTSDTVRIGAGGISPSVNGQRGEQNNFTMDGVLNNAIFTNVWAISPPPDALQEFAVQSHITDAQFAITSGSNINVVTRAGTNKFHGDLWEFFRNDVLDAQTFPDTTKLPYRQNQYGLYLGGPVVIPHLLNGRDNTWISGYWEGYRYSLTQDAITESIPEDMRNGDFSGIPETIYDPTTTPGNRTAFQGNKIPSDDLNGASQVILKALYPLPNLTVADTNPNNLLYPALNTTKSDNFGIRLDHKITDSDTMFLRLNRSNARTTTPDGLPTITHYVSNYSQEAALGYAHIFGPSAILNFDYGYTYNNDANNDQPIGETIDNAINFTQASPPRAGLALGPFLSIADGYQGLNQFAIPLGPQEGSDFHVDLSKVVSNHTIGVGAMYYHIMSFDDGWGSTVGFTDNGTSRDGLATKGSDGGFGPASFVLGVVDNYGPWVGQTGVMQTVNWYGLYAQDQWRATKRLTVTLGTRWDYVSPPNLHKIVSGLDLLTGQFLVTGPIPPYFPSANDSSPGYFKPQYNGWEPRFGITYQMGPGTVAHGAFAILDDHNNTVVQENQGLRLTWPTGITGSLSSLDLGAPQYYLNTLPAASTFLGGTPYASFGGNPDNRIPYSMQWNLGVQQQLTSSIVGRLDYVGSADRFQYIDPLGNTALSPGTTPISQREPFPQYGGQFYFEWNVAPASYNALEAELEKRYTSGLAFRASYTWSKSLDWQSDEYGSVVPVNFYNLPAEWGPSDYNRGQMFVFSSVYTLPFGKQGKFLGNANGFEDAVIGGWNLGSIITLDSGAPFEVLAGEDITNTADPSQRAERTGADAYRVSGGQSWHQWLNPAAFAEPAPLTYGNERRNDLVGPSFKNVDFNASKDFHLTEVAKLQFRSEFFNIFNHTNYGIPSNNLAGAGSFGTITQTANGGLYQGREIQFALKIMF
jgi:Carboxypeptidase regulatory-like domain/TonB dependent receptor